MRQRSEAGFSVIELLVVTVILGIIGGFVTTTLVRSMQVSRTVSERSQALHDIERSLQTVTRELRVADPIYLAADERYDRVIGAAVYRDRTVQVHTFLLDEDEDGTRLLFQEVSIYDLDAVGSGDPLASTPIELPRRRLITDVDNLDAIFTYHASDGTDIVCDPEVESDCADRYADATQIGIRLVRNIEGQEPIRAETRVNVRNTRYGRVS
jgi:prepilin-type N-terminal cleavage/methylation domain-containing protein